MYAWNALDTMDSVHQSNSTAIPFSVLRFEEVLSTSEVTPGKTAFSLDLDGPSTPITWEECGNTQFRLSPGPYVTLLEKLGAPTGLPRETRSSMFDEVLA